MPSLATQPDHDALEQPSDRRRRRSSDPITALHYQLAYARTEARLEALVLVDEGGGLVAAAGAWPVCEELAAYAPLLAQSRIVESAAAGSRLAALSTAAEVRAFTIDGAEALICGAGGGEGRSASLARAAAGCRRILGSADA